MKSLDPPPPPLPRPHGGFAGGQDGQRQGQGLQQGWGDRQDDVRRGGGPRVEDSLAA